MIGVYADGKQIATLSAEGDALAQSFAENKILELRDGSGQVMGHLASVRKQFPDEPPVPWDPSITEEELQRREREGPWYTFEEMKMRLGWQ